VDKTVRFAIDFVRWTSEQFRPPMPSRAKAPPVPSEPALVELAAARHIVRVRFAPSPPVVPARPWISCRIFWLTMLNRTSG